MGSTSTRKSKKTKKQKDYVSWFEIPALNLERAVNFYNYIFNIEMEKTKMNEYSMAFFPADKGIGGAVVEGTGCTPSQVGTLIYLNAGDDLNTVLSKVEAGGGRIIMAKTLIDEQSGNFALFIDTEGNKLALHSNN